MSAQIILTKRDVAIITMVYLFGGCSTAHVAARLFSALKSPRVSYRRIAELVQQGYLLGRRLPSSSGVGSGKNFLTLGPKGKPVVALALGLSESELARSRIDSPRFIEHHLAICDTRVAFELGAEKSRVVTVVEWSRDREVEVTLTKDGSQVTLGPSKA